MTREILDREFDQLIDEACQLITGCILAYEADERLIEDPSGLDPFTPED